MFARVVFGAEIVVAFTAAGAERVVRAAVVLALFIGVRIAVLLAVVALLPIALLLAAAPVPIQAPIGRTAQ